MLNAVLKYAIFIMIEDLLTTGRKNYSGRRVYSGENYLMQQFSRPYAPGSNNKHDRLMVSLFAI